MCISSRKENLGNWKNKQSVAGVGRMCFKRLIYQLSSASRWFCFHCSCFKAITTLSNCGPLSFSYQEKQSFSTLCLRVCISEGSVKPGLLSSALLVPLCFRSTLFTAGGTSKALKKMPMMSYHTSIMPFIETTCCPDSITQHWANVTLF